MRTTLLLLKKLSSLAENIYIQKFSGTFYELDTYTILFIQSFNVAKNKKYII